MTDVVPAIKKGYRVFSRGQKLVIRKRSTGVCKYNTNFVVPPETEQLLGLGAPRTYHTIIERAIAASVAEKTKSGYSTALNMLAACQAMIGRVMSLPLTDQDVLCFVAFMANRDVLDTTISSYLSAIRYALLSSGYDCENLRTPVVKQVLKGIHNLKRDPQAVAEKTTRRAMTIHHLKLLSHAIATSNFLTPFLKSALWAASLCAFWGSLRIGEILGPLVGSFDPKSTLLVSDVGIMEKRVTFWIRSPKKCTPTGDIIDVFEVPDKSLDPVRALKYYWEMRCSAYGNDRDLPFFLEENGKVLTKQRFNGLLHKLLDDLVEDKRDKLTGHSFRAGLATLMEVAGFDKEDIKAWGRWSSEAFQRYCKENRPRHRIFAMLYHFL